MQTIKLTIKCYKCLDVFSVVTKLELNQFYEKSCLFFFLFWEIHTGSTGCQKTHFSLFERFKVADILLKSIERDVSFTRLWNEQTHFCCLGKEANMQKSWVVDHISKSKQSNIFVSGKLGSSMKIGSVDIRLRRQQNWIKFLKESDFPL